MKRRIDQLLVERGLAESRHKAQALLMGGLVLVNEQKVEKPGQMVDMECALRLLRGLNYASRGGAKLEAALDHFGIDPSGRICADLGASTGGFTDCMLQRGAARVQAFDVGKGQLDWRLRTDPRVSVHDEFNVRSLTAADLDPQTTLITADLSFISLTKILAPLMDALRAISPLAGVDLVLLVKPQFEVGKGEVGKGGIVRDRSKREKVLNSVIEFARHCGYISRSFIDSPVAGAKGNVEFLLYLRFEPGLSSPV
jgi:23S rRNA (cytidine1920-2'-O)/16S rRNA (cytidine1409-2'-O)-methyltransferase